MLTAPVASTVQKKSALVLSYHTLRENQHLSSPRRWDSPSSSPRAEWRSCKEGKASSGVEKRFERELEIAMDTDGKPFNMVAEEPTSFYF